MPTPDHDEPAALPGRRSTSESSPSKARSSHSKLPEAQACSTRSWEAFGTPIAVGAFDVEVSASIGVALASDGRGFAQLLDDADRAMYEVKRTGGGNHQIALNPVLVGL